MTDKGLLIARRIQRCKDHMIRSEFDLLVLFPSVNMYYFSGFTDMPMERMLFLLIPSKGKPVFIAPTLYEKHIQRDSCIEDATIVSWSDSDEPSAILRDVLGTIRFESSRVLVDPGMWSVFLLSLQRVLQDCEFFPASEVVSLLRRIKSADEITSLEQSAAIADAVFDGILTQMDIKGMTELDLAAVMRNEMRKKGAHDIAGVFIASGPNGAIPHHGPGKRMIREGDVVVLDYGCKVDGYCSDMTRTIACGTPPRDLKKLYTVVKNAQDRAVQSVRPGIPAGEIDRIAREEIAREGYGEYFIHRTGHGIGLEAHEEPYIASGNDLKLEEGMTFSIEPGIYLPGKFGIRIEDIVLVTSNGGRRLNRSDRDLNIL